MGQILATFPAIPKTSQLVTLDGTQYTVTLYWRDRLGAWYLDLADLEGNALIQGRRVSPGVDVWYGCLPSTRPAGHLYVRGEDPYNQNMLGERVLLVYYGVDEVPAPAQESYLVTV